MSKPLIIYSGGSLDGFTSAWVYHRVLEGQVDIHYTKPTRKAPDVKGRCVMLMGMVFRDDAEMQRIIADASQVILVDNFKTVDKHYEGEMFRRISLPGRAACVALWDYCYHGKEPPVMMRYIEDAYLYKWQMSHSKEVRAALTQEIREFDNWTELMNVPDDEYSLEPFINLGTPLLKERERIIRSIIRETRRKIRIGSNYWWVINAPPSYASDAANELAVSCTHAAAYYDTPNGRHFDLRTLPESEISARSTALRFGGSGHPQAASFTVDRSHPLAKV